MATNSILEFKYSDGEDLCGLYIHSDTHANEFIPKLQDLFADVDNDKHKDRLNWDYLATKVIGKIIGMQPKSKLLNANCRQTNSVIYHTVITPIENAYASKKNHINDAIHISICHGGHNPSPIYEGLLSGFSPEPKV